MNDDVLEIPPEDLKVLKLGETIPKLFTFVKNLPPETKRGLPEDFEFQLGLLKYSVGQEGATPKNIWSFVMLLKRILRDVGKDELKRVLQEHMKETSVFEVITRLIQVSVDNEYKVEQFLVDSDLNRPLENMSPLA